MLFKDIVVFFRINLQIVKLVWFEVVRIRLGCVVAKMTVARQVGAIEFRMIGKGVESVSAINLCLNMAIKIAIWTFGFAKRPVNIQPEPAMSPIISQNSPLQVWRMQLRGD